MTAGYLAIGPSADTVSGNRVVLSAAPYTLSSVQIHVGNSLLNGMELGDYVRDAVQRGNQAPAASREIKIGIKVGGANEAAIATNLHALQNALKQARDGSKLSPLGPPVVLVWQADGGAPETYLDVIAGRIDELYRVGQRTNAVTTNGGQPVQMLLAVRPFFRQKQTASGNPTVTIATSGTISDCAGTYYIADVGADADSPLRLTVTDLSTSGKLINRFTVARRSLSPLASNDFSPILTPVAASPGASFSDATARGGATPRLAATSNAWQTLAKVTQPGTGLAQGGEVRIRLRARDSSPYIDPTDTNSAPTVTANVNAPVLSFAGGSPYGVTFATQTSLPTGSSNYTIATWIKTTDTTHAINLCGWGTAATTNSATILAIETITAGDPANGLKIVWGGATTVLRFTSAAIFDGTWHQVATTWDGTNRRLWIDNVNVASDTPAAHTGIAGTFAIANVNGPWAAGSELGPVRIYARDIGAAGIAQLYTQMGTADITSNLVGYYQYLEGAGATITDGGSGGNTGALQSNTTRANDAPPTVGLLPPDQYYVRLATVDAAGVESAASYPTLITLPHATNGLYETFESGGLANWDNSGYTQFYRQAASAATTQSGSAGSLTAIPDAAYEGTYGVRALVTSSVGAAANDGDVYRCVLQKAAQGVASGSSGTSTVYGRFRVNQITTPDGLMQSFIVFFSAAQGNTSGSVVGFSPDYTAVGPGGSNNSSGVMAGLRFIGGDIWQVCAPYGPGTSWTPVPGYYIHITNGQWYSFACSMTATFQGSGQYRVTFNGLTINGVLVTPALSATTVTSVNFPTTGAALTPTVGAELFGAPLAASPFWDLNDILSVDFDDVGAEATTALGNLAVSWPAITGASSYNLYYTPVESPTLWSRIVLGNVTSYTIAIPSSTAATLPQARLAGTIAPALLRVLIFPPNAAAVGGVPTSGGQPLLARSNWELVDVGVATLAAIPPQDAGVSPAPWVFLIQAQAAGSNSSVVDVDTSILASADEDMVVAEITGANLPSLGVWTFDLSRFDRQTCIVAPAAGGAATAYASITGQMHNGQGSTLLTVMAEISDSNGHFVTDLVHTAFNISAAVQPLQESV